MTTNPHKTFIQTATTKELTEANIALFRAARDFASMKDAITSHFLTLKQNGIHLDSVRELCHPQLYVASREIDDLRDTIEGEIDWREERAREVRRKARKKIFWKTLSCGWVALSKAITIALLPVQILLLAAKWLSEAYEQDFVGFLDRVYGEMQKRGE